MEAIDSGMFPAVLDSSQGDGIPGFLFHKQGLTKIDFEDISLASFVKFNSLKIEVIMIVGFEATNYPCITGLNKGS